MKPFLVRAANTGMSTVWALLSGAARWLSDKGILKSTKLPSRVISVGNLQAGGSGKTPLVAELARQAAQRGLSVCILCRGYGASWEQEGGVLEPHKPVTSVFEAGDEATLLRDLVPDSYIGVGANRVQQFAMVCEKLGRAPDLVILDDGFQHWKIQKDLQILAVTSKSWGETLFRDFPRALGAADLVVWTKGPNQPDSHGKPLARIKYRLSDEQATRLSQVSLLLVTGVGDSASVAELLSSSGSKIARHIRFPDHARYAAYVIREIVDDAKKSGLQVVITGKDWVKWRELGTRPTSVEVIEPELVFEKGRDVWDRVLWGG